MRIVAGKYRGRRLAAPRGRDVRPTSDRVREAVFDILFDVTNANVLDLYAGTGALGLEAVSRGAASAVLVEGDRSVYDVTKANVRSLQLGDDGAKVVVMHANAVRALDKMERSGAAFDLIFLDPPYADTLPQLKRIAGPALAVCAAETTLVVECPYRQLADVQHVLGIEWQARLVTSRRYGDTAVVIAAISDSLDQ